MFSNYTFEAEKLDFQIKKCFKEIFKFQGTNQVFDIHQNPRQILRQKMFPKYGTSSIIIVKISYALDCQKMGFC